VPPTPLKVNALSIVRAADVIVLVPEVAANVYVPVPPVNDMPVEALKLPYMVIEVLVTAPAYPVGFVPSVKSKSRYDPLVLRPKPPVPAVILKEILFASVTACGEIFLVVALLSVQIICGVPVTVMVVAPVKIVPVLFSDIVFVPKASVPVKPVQVKV
jgi:hypothetical protein